MTGNDNVFLGNQKGHPLFLCGLICEKNTPQPSGIKNQARLIRPSLSGIKK